MSERIALFPGTFDPFHRGHEDVVRRGLELFDRIIIGMGVNARKQRFFSEEVMLASIRAAFADEPRVTVESYDRLTAEQARRRGAAYLLRGLRNTTDFEYENSIAQANRLVYPNLETVFLICSPGLAYISSSIVRDLYRFGQDVSAFLPEGSAERLPPPPAAH